MSFVDSIGFWFAKMVAEFLWGVGVISLVLIVCGLVIWRMDVNDRKWRAAHGKPPKP